MNNVNIFELLFDGAEFTEINPQLSGCNAKAAFGSVNGVKAYAFCQNNGAFNEQQCNKLIKIYELAAKTGSPVIGIYSSDGVDLSEGFRAYSAYSRLLNKAFSVSGVVPQVSVIAGNTLGVNAIMCNTADVIIGVSNNDFYVSSDSQLTTDSAYEQGIIDVLCDSLENAVNSARQALSYLPQNNLAPLPVFDYSEPAVGCFDEGSVLELKKEYADNVSTFFATLSGVPVGVVKFNGNSLCPKCSYKAEAFIKLCDAYNLPLITFADSEGFSNKNDSQLIIALTKLASAYSNATCPKISVVCKQSVGGAFVILAGKGANADLTLAVENAVVSPLSVDSAVAFLYGERLAKGENREELKKEYALTEGSAKSAAESAAVDSVIMEKNLRSELISNLEMLLSKRETTIPRKHTVK